MGARPGQDHEEDVEGKLTGPKVMRRTRIR